MGIDTQTGWAVIEESNYRRFARECREAAESLKKGQGREQLLEVATRWERLAQQHDRRSSPM